MKVAFGTSLLDRGLLKANENGIDGIGQYCQELLSQFKKISRDTVPLTHPGINIKLFYNYKVSPSKEAN